MAWSNYSTGMVNNGTRLWTEYENNIMRDMYADNTNEDIGKVINRSWRAVNCQAIRLGLKKSDTHIRKRQVGNSKTYPIGGIRIRVYTEDGEKSYRKYIKTGYGVFDKVWTLLHHYIWITNNGRQLQKNECLRFIDGDPMNCEISNIEIVLQNYAMDKYWKNPKLKEIREINNLIRKINNKCQRIKSKI